VNFQHHLASRISDPVIIYLKPCRSCSSDDLRSPAHEYFAVMPICLLRCIRKQVVGPCFAIQLAVCILRNNSPQSLNNYDSTVISYNDRNFIPGTDLRFFDSGLELLESSWLSLSGVVQFKPPLHDVCHPQSPVSLVVFGD